MVEERRGSGQDTPTAVLCSGGLDSAVLVGHEADRGPVQPVYVACGLAWELLERDCLDRFLAAASFGQPVHPLVSLHMPVTDTYPPSHWALTGTPPAYDTPDEDVYLLGRNVLLLSKVAVYCALHDLTRIAIGPLAGNPFPDATPVFFAAMGDVLARGLDRPLTIEAPFSTWSKRDVIVRGGELGLPLEHTLSCMNPAQRRHCGRCSKCRERLQAFEAAGLADPAAYGTRPASATSGI